jgi:hypothetical protein
MSQRKVPKVGVVAGDQKKDDTKVVEEFHLNGESIDIVVILFDSHNRNNFV